VAAVRYYAEWNGRSHVVEIVSGADGTVVRVDGVPHPADLRGIEGSDLHSLLLDSRSVAFAARFEDGVAVLQLHDREVRVPIEDERTRETKRLTAGHRRPSGRGGVKSVMPGIVKEVRVRAGDAVQPGQALLVLEAMKMENEIRSDRAGRVARVLVTPGQAVEKGALLAVVEDLTQ
jgi:biotin carboxyl carrier protein